jgi:hypothetical protein
VKLSDPIHYVKNYKGELYTQVNMPKKKNETCKADAMRLSHNLAYMLAQHTPSKDGCTFEKFETAGEASFEHHWNNHEHCGEWCQTKKWTEEEKIQKKGKFRDKIKNKREYEQQLKVKQKYLSTSRMRRCYHRFCNNKTEQLHGLVVNVFLPKRLYYCRTICGRARNYEELYAELGISMSTVTKRFYHQHDVKRKREQVYENSPERKKKRARRKLDQIRKAWKAEVEDKAQGHTYQSRIMAPAVRGTEAGMDDAGMDNGVRGASIAFCKACGCYGHQRRTSKKCTQNRSSPLFQSTYRYVDSVQRLLVCVVSKYSYFASRNAGTNLSYAFYEKGIQSCPASKDQTEQRIAHPAPIPT